jgi:hypothetical protein
MFIESALFRLKKCSKSRSKIKVSKLNRFAEFWNAVLRQVLRRISDLLTVPGAAPKKCLKSHTFLGFWALPQKSPAAPK